jgi:hypothetical protein
MHELGVEPHHVEAILNHVSGHKEGTAGVYNHATYRAQMAQALLRWADHVESIVTSSERKIAPARSRKPKLVTDGAELPLARAS